MYLENLRHVETQQTHTDMSKCLSSKYFVTYQVKGLAKLINKEMYWRKTKILLKTQQKQ